MELELSSRLGKSRYRHTIVGIKAQDTPPHVSKWCPTRDGERQRRHDRLSIAQHIARRPRVESVRPVRGKPLAVSSEPGIQLLDQASLSQPGLGLDQHKLWTLLVLGPVKRVDQIL